MEGAQIGPYRVLGDLGSGGMGKVYLAEVAGHAPGIEDGCRVALKVSRARLDSWSDDKADAALVESA